MTKQVVVALEAIIAIAAVRCVATDKAYNSVVAHSQHFVSRVSAAISLCYNTSILDHCYYQTVKLSDYY